MKYKNSIPFLGFFLILISVILLISGLSQKNQLMHLPLAVTILLISNVLMAGSSIQKYILYIVLQILFFLFLIAGPLINSFSNDNFFISFSTNVVNKTWVCYWIAAFSMWLYLFISVLEKKTEVCNPKSCMQPHKAYDLPKIRSFSKFIFFVSATAFVVTTFDKIAFRQLYSLQTYYAEYQSRLPSIVVKIADCYLISFSLFLATKPSKKEATMPISVFIVISALTIFYGVRHIITLNILFLIIYTVFRNGDKGEVWLSKRGIVIGSATFPFVMILLQAFDTIRRNVNFEIYHIKDMLSFNLVKEFFVSQSVSSNILPYGITYQDIIDGPVFYTFGSVYTYLKQNMIVRFFSGEGSYSANSVEAAFQSGNLGARLAYQLYRESYLLGTGMGGSYVADLYVDFSYIGVFLGTILICVVLRYLTNFLRQGSPFKLAFVLVAIRWITYIPRDTYFGWAIQTFSFMNLFFVFIIVMICKLSHQNVIGKNLYTTFQRTGNSE